MDDRNEIDQNEIIKIILVFGSIIIFLNSVTCPLMTIFGSIYLITGLSLSDLNKKEKFEIIIISGLIGLIIPNFIFLIYNLLI